MSPALSQQQALSGEGVPLDPHREPLFLPLSILIESIVSRQCIFDVRPPTGLVEASPLSPIESISKMCTDG